MLLTTYTKRNKILHDDGCTMVEKSALSLCGITTARCTMHPLGISCTIVLCPIEKKIHRADFIGQNLSDGLS